MAIQSCSSCSRSFTWKEVQKTLLRGYKPIVCSKCGEKHQINDFSKLLIGMLVTFPTVAFILLISRALSLSPSQTFIIGLLLLAGTIISLPFIAKYDKADNQTDASF